MSDSLTALVIDDHPLVARGIADFLLSHCGFVSVNSVSNTTDFWNFLDPAMPPALVVMDFWLPDGVSLPLLQDIQNVLPNLPILVISADDDIAVKNKIRNSHARGFLHKQESPEVFARAVSALLQGENWFGSNLQPCQPESAKDLPVTAAELGLTTRQGQILAMILKGQPNKRIALNLSLSEQTIKEHVSGILDRLGAHNRIELITRLRGKRLE